MKRFSIHALAAVSGFVCLVSCADQESELPSLNQSSNNQLSIVTHTREGETPIASVYLFNGSNEFVRTLQTDASSYTSASASVKLLQGTYTLCAINASALSSFLIPESPTPTTVITPVSGQPMGDLLMATGTATLSDGESKTVDMSLERKVIELSSVTISQVPADVTGVAVSIAPFYSAIRFNGTYVDADPATCSFTLSTTSTDGVWHAAPQQLAFPSKGVPTITVTFTYDDETTCSYTYTSDAALTANNKYDITGTYTEPLGVTLSGSITFQLWTTDPTAINFDFDESNAGNSSSTDPVDIPVQGELYNDYYVVSVDGTNRKAVLLSKTQKKDVKQQDCQSYLAGIPKPEGANGNWRIPTVSECQTFLSDPDTPDLTYDSDGYYLCLLDGALNRIQVTKTGETIEISSPISAVFNSVMTLRAVIDILY